jgi:hypothetical protein
MAASPFRLTGIEHLCYAIGMSKTLTRTICCKLDVDGHDTALAATQHAFNQAATWVARVCWDEGITNTDTAHHRVYGETRADFGRGAQLAVCARAKAVEAIKATKAKRRDTCPTFGPRGSVRYDARTYRLMSLDRVSLNTLEGRVVCRLMLGARQHALLVDPAWEVGGPIWSGEPASTTCPSPRAAKRRPKPSQPAGRWAWTWASPIWPPIARASTPPARSLTSPALATTRDGSASGNAGCATPSAASAAWAVAKPASSATPTTASASSSSGKPPSPARQSPSTT